ncbi:MAG: GtrA family protein, partial [Ignavibacteriales bacterium]
MKKRLTQLYRFGIVGLLNTFIDYGLFNIVILLTEVEGGVKIGLLNLFCVALAATNSYYFNRTWTFEADRENYSTQIRRFVIATGIGIIINSTVVSAAA